MLESLPGDTRNVLLTLARIWTTLATGTIVSKDDAAGWVLGRLAPERRLALEYARRLYLTTSYADETWSDALKAQVGRCVDEIVAQIQLAASGTHRSTVEQNAVATMLWDATGAVTTRPAEATFRTMAMARDFVLGEIEQNPRLKFDRSQRLPLALLSST